MISDGKFGFYAKTLILVDFLLINFFTEMIISRDHKAGEVPEYVEINPTSLPELSKPSRNLGNLRKTKKIETNKFKKIDFLISGPRFEPPDLSSWLYIQFFMRNPNLRSKNAKF